jgi:hypothetical protein
MFKGTATRFEFKQGKFGIYGLGSLQDHTGRVEDMFFASSDKSPLPQQSLLNLECIYNVQWDANKQKFKAYFQSYADQPEMPNAYQQPHQATPPQNTQQAPPQAAQSTNSNSSVDLLTDIYGVLCKILAIVEKETDFAKKYDLGKDPDFPNPPGKPVDMTNPAPVEDDTVPW